jgi:predicted Zn-dependent peptidase
MSLLVPARASAQQFDATISAPQESHLRNGMSVIIEEDHRVPLVSLALRYDETAAPAELQATAALTTSLMLSRTTHVQPGHYQQILAQAGATGVSERTEPGAATFQVTVPANRLALPLWLWSDQIGFFDGELTDDRVAQQRTLLHEQRRVALEGAPLGRLDLFAAEELYPPSNPYYYGSLRPEDVDHVDRTAVLAFHDTWITPEHATLVIVGDVVTADALGLVDRYFGTLARGRASAPSAVPLPMLTGETQIDVTANVANPVVSVRWPTPAFLTLDDARLDVLARILAGKRTAWLIWKLADDKKVATNVTARQRSDLMGSQFEIRVEGAKGQKPIDLLAALDVALDELRVREPPDSELAGSIYENVIDRLLSRERAQTRAFDALRCATLRGNADAAKIDLGRFARVDRGAVRDAMSTFLPRDRRVVFLVTPGNKASMGGDRGARRVKAVSP